MPEVGGGETKADQGTAVGASVGAVLGGIAGLAALSIPGIGPLLAAGPIAAALGALTGTAPWWAGGLVHRLGIPEEQAKGYEAAVRAGVIVIVVRVADSAAEARAERILRESTILVRWRATPRCRKRKAQARSSLGQ